MPELPEKPLNREPEVEDLIQSFITYKDGYDRNHSQHPHLDGDKHRVEINGAVNSILHLSISQLSNDFEQHSVVCALQCAGNRRHTMRTELKEVDGIDWFDGAVMNCKWTGPRVKDVLAQANISLTLEEQKKAHVAFACYAKPCQDDTWYGASIPLTRVMDEDAEVILALKMNDQPLTVGHGHPVRVIIPGIAGARSVKWLEQITVQTVESSNVYMQRDYKILPEEVTNAEQAQRFFPFVPPVHEMPVNSAVVLPKPGTTVQRDVDGSITVQGYALPSGDDGPVTKVEVSGDDGRLWTEAEIVYHEGTSRWSWVLWKAQLKIEPGSNKTIFSNAFDTAGNSQPRHSQWNLRGVCYNGFGVASDLTIM